MARLAGVPDQVLASARERLQALEQSQAEKDPVQADLFNRAAAPMDARAEEQSALREALSALDPDGLSPREALERLYELKRLYEQSL